MKSFAAHRLRTPGLGATFHQSQEIKPIKGFILEHLVSTYYTSFIIWTINRFFLLLPMFLFGDLLIIVLRNTT